MAGSQQYNRQATISALPSKEIRDVTIIIPSEEIPPGGSETIYIYASQNKVGKINNFKSKITELVGATTGRQLLYVTRGYQLVNLQGKQNNSGLYYQYNQNDINTSILPNENIAFINTLRNTFIDENKGLTVQYSNVSDVSKVPNNDFISVSLLEEKTN